MNSKGSASVKLALALILVLLIGGGIGLAFLPSKNQGYAPDQPIPFSHKLHAGDNKIPCQYCHIGADRSRHSTVPPVAVCMNCHLVVKADSPWVQQIHKHFNEGTPIPWIRIHNVLDFTYFSHKRHVNKGLKCQICHGEVQEMEKIRQFAPLTMGWCVNCHRKPEYNAPTNCDTCHR